MICCDTDSVSTAMLKTPAIKLVGISGSVRKGSTNTGLLRAAKKNLPPNVTMEIVDLADIPIYNDDLWEGKSDDSALPESLRKFRAQVAAADAVVIACPEYNFSVSSTLKTALDWGSKNPNVFANKPGAILGAGGTFATVQAQNHLRQIGVFLGITFLNYPHLFAINRFAPPHNAHFDAATGEVIHEDLHKKISGIIEALVAYTIKQKA
ncbi:hypothetical protein CEUSTIGMA_g8587.t1 [Chlamydomonas eustigma]|uniref:NAD(P)H dehydrogenase (quinone) n=1 Tax=Chlamydomonas eustigma TaxID=1157962 RepID=A0A250XDK9_9CHLO|nr:hypothetical protein CEUSTIGMA_g8587.t1 [Chlamydomonas eustigma]|eukprot:GAX81154.1 hypothetical protein CEUSTIGMA_g8587.t1 [Chlamydomonas eustigma]